MLPSVLRRSLSASEHYHCHEIHSLSPVSVPKGNPKQPNAPVRFGASVPSLMRHMAVYRLLVTPGHNPAVHIPNRTRYPTCIVREQKHDHRRHIARFSDPTNWVKIIEGF